MKSTWKIFFSFYGLHFSQPMESLSIVRVWRFSLWHFLLKFYSFSFRFYIYVDYPLNWLCIYYVRQGLIFFSPCIGVSTCSSTTCWEDWIISSSWHLLEIYWLNTWGSMGTIYILYDWPRYDIVPELQFSVE